MKIVIDMQGAQNESRFRGIGRYTNSLVEAIVKNKGDHEIVLVLNGLLPDAISSIRNIYRELLPQSSILIWHGCPPTAEWNPANILRREASELLREAFLLNLKPDFLLITSLFEGYVDDAIISIGNLKKDIPTALIVYDFIQLLNPKKYLDVNPNFSQHYKRKIQALKKADLFFGISDSSSNEVKSLLKIPQEKIVTISAAADFNFKRVSVSEKSRAHLLKRLGISKPFILYSGAADPRKNLLGLVKAFGILDKSIQKSYQMLLVGKMHQEGIDELRKMASDSRIPSKSIVFGGYVDNEDLIKLYNLCELFVFPSLHEGFGLPVLEAMSCGAAVICSDRTSLPEVIGFDQAMFNPDSPDSIAEKITQVLADAKFKTILKKHGIEQSKKFSWDKVAIKAINALEQANSKLIKNSPLKKTISMNDLVDRIGYLLPNKDVDDLDLVKISSSISYNFQEPLRKPKIFVDISELVIRDLKTGVQQVVRSILLELCHNPPKDFDVVPVYCNLDKSGYFKANSYIDSFLDKTSGEENNPMIEFYTGDVFLGLDLQHAGVIKQKDYLLWMKAHGVKIHFVVYDLLPITLPEFYWPEISRAHSDWFDVIRSFDSLICISKSVAEEVTKLIFNRRDLNKHRPKVNWFHLGADTINSSPSFGLPNDSQEVLRKLRNIPTFLIVGTLEPRKGHSQVLAAFELLWARGININLVFVGKKGWHVDSLIKNIENSEQFKKRLYWLDGISDEYLDLIYDSCICLIAASRAEGFGLPLIEAAQKGLPLIVRDIPVFREVAGKNAYYFSGLKSKDFERALISWMKLYENQQHPKSKDMPYLNWKQSVRDLINLI